MRIPWLFVLAACSESGSQPPCKPRQLARADAWGGQIAVDERFVYWTEGTTGRVMRAERPEGAPTVLDEPFELPNNGSFFQLQFGMVAAGGAVHFTANVDGQQAIFTTTADGVTTRRVLGCFGPRLVAVGDTVVALSCSDPTLLVLPPSGPVGAPNLGSLGRGIVAGSVTIETSVTPNQGPCCDLRSFALNGSSTLIASQTFATPIARHGDTLFVVEGDLLSSVPIAGGTPTLLAQLPGQIDPGSGAADATHVYVKVVAAGGSENDLFAVRRTGGEQRFLASVNVPAEIVAAEDDGVYWSTIGAPPNGGVFRLDRCAYE